MKTSLIIPALNEVKSIGETLKQVPKDFVDEIIVADGHSTDGTPELVRKLGYRVVEEEGMGFGSAIISGIKESTGDVIIIMDADGSHNPKDIPRLLEKIKEGYDIGWGSRYLPGGGSADDTLLRHFGNKFFTFLTRLIHGVKVADILYLFAAFRREVFDSLELKSTGFEFCIELPVKAHKAGFKFGEVSCFERKRFADESRVKDFSDGLKILLAILKKY